MLSWKQNYLSHQCLSWEDGARDVAANPQGLSTGPEKPGFRGKKQNTVNIVSYDLGYFVPPSQVNK
jgi:hypothetical protein